MLELPDSKTGAKTIQLNAPALEVLAGIEHKEGNPYVMFGKAPGAPLVNVKDPCIRRRAGMPELRIHDLRSPAPAPGSTRACRSSGLCSGTRRRALPSVMPISQRTP